jgi:hypothetical protein
MDGSAFTETHLRNQPFAVSREMLEIEPLVVERSIDGPSRGDESLQVAVGVWQDDLGCSVPATGKSDLNKCIRHGSIVGAERSDAIALGNQVSDD